MRRGLSLWLGLLVVALAGCDKAEPPADGIGAKPTATPGSTANTAASAASTAVVATPPPAASAKVFDCGEKGQKTCPMQGWMKTVMGAAVADEDADKIAAALTTVAQKDPGFPKWKAIATEGAEKAKKGDVDGAKQSCKACHDLYKKTYITTMRDMPW